MTVVILRRLLSIPMGLALLGLLACVGASPQDLPPAHSERTDGTEPPRVLFFALDSIPYSLVAELTDPTRGDERLFEGFSRPTRLISSFPSTSSVAFTGILEPFDLPRPPGYEAKFFDREANEIRGGGLISYYTIPFGWREFFTWRYNNPIKRAFATARPAKLAPSEVRWVMERFLESDERSFHGYVALTDGAAHLKGPESLTAALETLDAEIRRVRREHPEEPFYAVVYSDHGIAGGEPLDNVREGVQEALAAEGYDLGGSIRGSDDAVMVPFGLVSSFEVYAEPGEGPEIADTLAPVEGVDLCVARLEGSDRWLVTSERGDAVLGRRRVGDREQWSYRPAPGSDGADPLGYRRVLTTLRDRAGDPRQQWFPDSWWFDATQDHFYPDALHRMGRTFDLVENAASTVCSLAPGYMYGALSTALAARLTMGRLRWTHGALYDDASHGFLLTDLPGWYPPPAVRFDEALRPFSERLVPQLSPRPAKTATLRPNGLRPPRER